LDLLVVADGLDGRVGGDERRLRLLDGLVQVPQVAPFRLPEQTVFIDWRVVIVARGDERTARSPVEVGATMILSTCQTPCILSN
jgi:hypothetical protein